MDPKTPIVTPTDQTLRPALAACLVAIALAGSGCEERVVSVNQSPMTGLSTNMEYDYRPVSSLSREEAAEEGFLEDVGEFLFGWMDGEEADGDRRTTEREFAPIWRREQPGRIRMPDQSGQMPTRPQTP